MIGPLGTPELLIILVVVLLLFGVGRISKVGHELGAGVQAFKRGIADAKSVASETDEQINQV